ncbi:hypothetical protein B0H16DRAFT_1596850 [Mycena metata]|uniref:Uncharacterized protein n=1 Tax=Mycena metata TaxID=1033252 RepID=A0AAD7HNG4_9AGAR|nr:hypothetical protein B0H16DRAFT_1596850 [Mycena metata]
MFQRKIPPARQVTLVWPSCLFRALLHQVRGRLRPVDLLAMLLRTDCRPSFTLPIRPACLLSKGLLITCQGD